LYEILNDDDDDIRSVGSETVSLTSKQSLAPIEAQRRVLEGLLARSREEPTFHWNVVLQLTGGEKWYADGIEAVARESGSKISEKGSTLFAEEEPNIYSDAVRDLKHWTKAFLQLPIKKLQSYESELGKSPIDILREWVITEFQKLRDNVVRPFTRVPKRALAWHMRVLYCAITVVAHFIRATEALDPAHPLDTAGAIEKFDPEELHLWKLDNGLEDIVRGIEDFAFKPPAMGLHQAISSLILSPEWLKLTKLDILSVQIAAMSRQPQTFLSLKS